MGGEGYIATPNGGQYLDWRGSRRWRERRDQGHSAKKSVSAPARSSLVRHLVERGQTIKVAPKYRDPENERNIWTVP